MSIFGLVGYPLDHSWSPDYFAKKFARENNQSDVYKLFPLSSLNDFHPLIQNISNLKGLNVTIPYKSAIIPFLSSVDDVAREVNAVNTVTVTREDDGIITRGYNTDIQGFESTFITALQSYHTRALVFGTGGASKAVAYVLKKLGIPFTFVSRSPGHPASMTYEQLEKEGIANYLLLINTTPLGQYPTKGNPVSKNIASQITGKHYLFDLVYNPAETEFLKAGKEKGAFCVNGMEMLIRQAEESWKIWNR